MEQRGIGSGTVDPATVVLVDDHTMFRQGLRQSLAENGVKVVGEASNGQAGARLALELRPDVVVMDLNMPQMDGIQATRTILESQPAARVLMLTIATDEDGVIEALTAGASGYVLKSAPPDDVVRAVYATRDGDSTLSPEVATRLVERLRAGNDRPSPPASLDALTPREREILRLVGEGKENQEIADALFLSPSTVKNHVANVLEKLGMQNRVQAAVYAARAGLV